MRNAGSWSEKLADLRVTSKTKSASSCLGSLLYQVSFTRDSVFTPAEIIAIS